MRLLALSIMLASLAAAQSFDQWFDELIERQRVARNGEGAERQRESPSADRRSTSLVDQSAATDFISVAMNVIPVTPGISRLLPSGSPTTNGSNGTGSGTATASLYALLAALNKTKPTDPQFYRQHVNARRLSFTLGTAVSKIETDNTEKPATVVGAKLLLINRRELYTRENLAFIADVQKKVTNFAVASAGLKDRIQRMMFQALHPEAVKPDGTIDLASFTKFVLTAFSTADFPNTLNALPETALDQIEELVNANSGPYAQLKATLDNTYDRISTAPQLALAYIANVRSELGNNYHRAEIIYDYGVSERILWTFNGSADYTDRKSGIDSRGGRFATEFQGALTRGREGFSRLPVRLSFSGEGKWMTKQKPQYTVQAKLSVPLAAGVELPLVYRYANRIEQINEKSSEARIGLSIDLMRLVAGIK